jgi:hypothetical protein
MDNYSITINPIHNEVDTNTKVNNEPRIIENNCTCTSCLSTTICFLLFMFLLFLSFGGYVLLLAVNGSDDPS